VSGRWSPADMPDLTGRRALVTGVTSGLGETVVEGLVRRGAEVLMAGRDERRLADAVAQVQRDAPGAVVHPVLVDLADLASVRRAAAEASTYGPIDVLVNNAGVMATPYARTVDGFELQLATNHLGHWTLTALLMPALLRAGAARIVSVTSTAHHLGRPLNPTNPQLEGSYRPWRAYCQSKLANFHFGIGLQRRLADAGAPAASLIAHPGLSDTELQAVSVRETRGGLSQRFFHGLARSTGMTPEQGARPQLRAATDPAARGGQFYAPRYFNNGPPVRRPILRRIGMDAAIARLWEVSERATGVAIDVSRQA
jgi:NAD(P)-dependent dehydrogenase (short-subunit alcohol dehydrogenase family)